jgi:nicotinamidase-related amidase
MSKVAPVPGTLLLCLDLQPVFLRAVEDGTRLSRRCGFAIAAAHGLGLPVVFTEQVPQKLGGTAPELLATAARVRVFGKETFSAFADGQIRRSLQGEGGVEHLLLCGLETPVCVYQTALDAISAGLHVTLLSDCVGARRADDAEACIQAMAHAGVHVLPAETVFYAMLHDVQHPFFKAYTQLVKSHG